MLRVLLELAPCLLTGLWLGRWQPQWPERLAPPLLRWGMPVSLVALLLRAGLPSQLLPVAAFTAALTTGGLLLSRFTPWSQHLFPRRSLQLGSVVGNTAYFGLPVAITLLPAQALSTSITYDLIGTLVTWGLGPLLLSDRARDWKPLLNNPVVVAMLIALPLGISPWGVPLGTWLWIPARLVLWLLLLLVGMRLGLVLAQLDDSRLLRLHELMPALGVKLLLLPLVALLASQGLPLSTAMRQALVLQAAAPTAMSVLLLAEGSQQKSREVIPAAQLVLWSTLVSLLSVPLWFQLTLAM
jgi:predicted permease